MTLLFNLAKGEIFLPKKLNDTQVLEIVTKHANGTSISALAKEYKIDWNTCKKYITDSRDIHENIKTIKNETITQWLESNKSKLTGILNQITDLLPEKLKNANARALFGGLKILTDLGVNINKDGNGDNGESEKGITFIFTDTSAEGESNE